MNQNYESTYIGDRFSVREIDGGSLELWDDKPGKKLLISNALAALGFSDDELYPAFARLILAVFEHGVSEGRKQLKDELKAFLEEGRQ